MAQRCGPEQPVSPACSPRSCEPGRECICTVCTCGYHKCPPRHTSVHTEFGNPRSEYSSKYPEWPIPEKLQRKIAPAQLKIAPPQPSNPWMAFTTTYSNHYVKHPLISQPSRRPTPKIEDTGPFQTLTTYNNDYWDKSAATSPRAKSAATSPRAKTPQPQHIKGKSFEGQSVYTLQFPNPGPQPRIEPVCSPSSWRINEGARFHGNSTYHDDYHPRQMPERYVHPKVEYNPSPSGKDYTTTYQTDFVQRQMQSLCPALTRGKPSSLCGDHMCY